MFCPACGYDADNANFCPECGKDLSFPAKPSVCRACGTEVGEARFCPECGVEVAGRRARTTGSAAGRAAGREPIGSQPERRSGGRKLPLVAAVAAVAVAAVVAFIVLTGPGKGSPAVAEEAVVVDGKVKIPLQDLAGGEARFYTYDAGGVPVRYFVMQSPDGLYRAAFDASKECGPYKKGFRQEGNDMVCNRCQERFASIGINVQTGECNPAAIDRKVSGEALVLNTADLEQGVQYFQ